MIVERICCLFEVYHNLGHGAQHLHARLNPPGLRHSMKRSASEEPFAQPSPLAQVHHWRKPVAVPRRERQGWEGSCGKLPGSVDPLNEVPISGGQATDIVTRDRELHLVVDVGPLGMVKQPFGDQRNMGHEGERRTEVGELIRAAQDVTITSP